MENWSCLWRGDITCIDHMWPWLLRLTPFEMFPIAESLWIGGFGGGQKKWLGSAVVWVWGLLTDEYGGILDILIIYFAWDFGFGRVNIYGIMSKKWIFDFWEKTEDLLVLWNFWWRDLILHVKMHLNTYFEVILINNNKDFMSRNNFPKYFIKKFFFWFFWKLFLYVYPGNFELKIW